MDLLRIALENLLENVWKLTPKKKKTDIRCGRIEVEKRVVSYLRDNGVGFKMSLAHMLVETFQRLHGRREFEGYGIGLSTVKAIIERPGGKIWADGEVGTGATFFFSLG